MCLVISIVHIEGASEVTKSHERVRMEEIFWLNIMRDFYVGLYFTSVISFFGHVIESAVVGYSTYIE